MWRGTLLRLWVTGRWSSGIWSSIPCELILVGPSQIDKKAPVSLQYRLGVSLESVCIVKIAYVAQLFNIVLIICEITLTADCPCRASGFPSEGATIQIPVPIHACILHQAEGLLEGRSAQLSLLADAAGLLPCFADALCACESQHLPLPSMHQPFVLMCRVWLSRPSSSTTVVASSGSTLGPGRCADLLLFPYCLDSPAFVHL